MPNNSFKRQLIDEIRLAVPTAFQTAIQPTGSGGMTSLTGPLTNSNAIADTSASATAHLSFPLLRSRMGCSVHDISQVHDVRDLLKLNDSDFVRRCYQLILRREPDGGGFQNYLQQLQNGSIERLKLIQVLMDSDEGKKANVHLPGLSRARRDQLLRRLPVLGVVFNALDAIRKVPELQARIDSLESQLADQTHQLRFANANAASGYASANGAETEDQSGGKQDYDQFYLEFENEFRGTREHIKEFQQYYIPIIQDLRSRLGMHPVLDVCCGRGEWLELLDEHGIFAEGVDINTASLSECHKRNLTAHHDDAFEFLRRANDSSYLAVTSFHFIEHLHIDQIRQLVREIRRVLIPGGMLILETPNPTNVIVGSHNFYLDPTHKNPLPPALMKFVVKQLGFQDVTIAGLHPSPNRNVIRGVEGADVLNGMLFGDQDYAVMGIK